MQYLADVNTIANFINNDIRLSLNLESHVIFRRETNHTDTFIIPITYFKITSERMGNNLRYGVSIGDQFTAYLFFDKIFNLVYSRLDTLTFIYNGGFNMYFCCTKDMYDEIAPVC